MNEVMIQIEIEKVIIKTENQVCILATSFVQTDHICRNLN